MLQNPGNKFEVKNNYLNEWYVNKERVDDEDSG